MTNFNLDVSLQYWICTFECFLLTGGEFYGKATKDLFYIRFLDGLLRQWCFPIIFFPYWHNLLTSDCVCVPGLQKFSAFNCFAFILSGFSCSKKCFWCTFCFNSKTYIFVAFRASENARVRYICRCSLDFTVS